MLELNSLEQTCTDVLEPAEPTSAKMQCLRVALASLEHVYQVWHDIRMVKHAPG